jgi:hypothetical protein
MVTTTTTSAPDLLSMTAVQLDEMFDKAQPGPIPEGVADGTAIIAAGSAYSHEIARLINHFAWQGKVFNPDTGELVNRILPIGWKAIVAKVYLGESWFDQKPCVVLDYAHTSLIAHWIRDEIRRIEPGLYLGKVYWDKTPLFHFSLMFTSP